jgi:hypothetical protein
MKRADNRLYPYHPVSVRRDQRLREIERAAWRWFGAALTGLAFGAWFAYLTF